MNVSKQILTCSQVKQIDLVDYLRSLEHEPVKIRGNNYWYLSPLRTERTASFKIDRRLNCWYDHGIGKGGNIIDFAMLYHNCTIAELLRNLQGNFSFHKQVHALPENTVAAKIKITSKKALYSLSLIHYLKQRNIPFAIASKYCCEIGYELNSKSYYSIGFLNDSGGYELRNVFCKNSSAPKDITTIKNSSKKVIVFEGFFDFLSFMFLFQNEDLHQWDFCILNSLSFFEKARAFLEQHEAIHLYLDNDRSGQYIINSALKIGGGYINESSLYKNYKDLNEWLVKHIPP